MAKPEEKRTPTRRAAKIRALKLEIVPIERLRLWKDNPRDNDEAAEKLAKLIRQHGFIDPIVATRDELIRAGNTRYKAARLAGMVYVPVIYVKFKSEADAQLYSLADNKANELASWNTELLRDLFGQLQTLGEGVVSAASGFSPMEIEGLETQLSGFGAQTFSEAVEEFERLHPDTANRDLYVWMIVPDRDTFDALVERFGATKAATGHRSVRRELAWDAVRKALVQYIRVRKPVRRVARRTSRW